MLAVCGCTVNPSLAHESLVDFHEQDHMRCLSSDAKLSKHTQTCSGRCASRGSRQAGVR